MFEELGVSCPCQEIGSFVYRHQFSSELFEYEYDHVFVGNFRGSVFPNPEEIMEVRWFELEELLALMNQKPDSFASWFITALDVYKRQAPAHRHLPGQRSSAGTDGQHFSGQERVRVQVRRRHGRL